MGKFKTMHRFSIILFVMISIVLLVIRPAWVGEQDPYQSATSSPLGLKCGGVSIPEFPVVPQ